MARKPTRPSNDEIDKYYRFASALDARRIQAVERWVGWCQARGLNAYGQVPRRRQGGVRHSFPIRGGFPTKIG